MAAAGLLNAVLDPFLIFGLGPFPELGIAGAAWATVTAWSVGFVYLMHLLVIQRELVSASLPSLEAFRQSGRYAPNRHSCCRCQHDDSLASGVMTAIAAGFGGNAVAAYGVGARLEPMATCWFWPCLHRYRRSSVRITAPGAWTGSGRHTIWRSASSACGSWGSTCFWPSPRHCLLLFFLRITR